MLEVQNLTERLFSLGAKNDRLEQQLSMLKAERDNEKERQKDIDRKRECCCCHPETSPAVISVVRQGHNVSPCSENSSDGDIFSSPIGSNLDDDEVINCFVCVFLKTFYICNSSNVFSTISNKLTA